MYFKMCLPAGVWIAVKVALMARYKDKGGFNASSESKGRGVGTLEILSNRARIQEDEAQMIESFVSHSGVRMHYAIQSHLQP